MTLFIWLKFLYFLRIFSSTGYLIRIIIDVIKDMRFFLMILLLTFIAFGDSMYQISSKNELDNMFISGGTLGAVDYIYEIVLGNFDTSAFGTVATPYVWVLFLLCTVMNMIIMFNLLIAIISESFAKINSVSVQASYQEKASMIAENSYLIPWKRKQEFSPENTYLLVALDAEQELKESIDPVEQ